MCPGVGKPVLVIPWIVMQELDNHKSRSNGRLAGKARKAVRLLFSCFSSNHPRVRCQTMEEVTHGPDIRVCSAVFRTIVNGAKYRFWIMWGSHIHVYI